MKINHKTDISKLSDISQKLTSLIDEISRNKEFSNQSLKKWKIVCSTINSELKKNIIRIAVVGSIKSGKSTFVNSIFGKDYLKRGAGVITSIVTRTRKGTQNQATLFLKNWKEINHEINQASISTPLLHEYSWKDKVDIRLEENRRNLKAVINNIQRGQFIPDCILDTNISLISSYLKGYDQINQYIGEKNKIMKLSNNQFMLHQKFISDDNLAVYIKDVLIEIKGNNLESNIEIADCQGSDSLNPLHLSMIQEYLNISHLVIYVISSRTGMRQSDVKLLSIMRKMGIYKNVIFVVNSDLNEHESRKSLEDFTMNVKELLYSVQRSHLQVFTVSALHSLLKSPFLLKKSPTIQENEKPDLVKFVEHEYKMFQKAFLNKINRDKYFLLTANPIKKLTDIIKIMETWTKLYGDMLNSKFLNSKELTFSIDNSQEELIQTKTLIMNSIDGTMDRIKKELFLNIEEFFDDSRRGLVNKIGKFIQKWNDSNYTNYTNLGQKPNKDLTRDISKFFQKFKQSLEKYTVEKVNPDLIHFTQSQELKLLKFLEPMATTYLSTFKKAIEKYNSNMEKFNVKIKITELMLNIPKNLTLLKKNVKPRPLILNSIQFPTKIKTKALLNIGLGKTIGYLLKALGIAKTYELYTRKKILKTSMEELKKETEVSVFSQLKNYKENLKFQHIAHLSDIVASNLKQQATNYLDGSIIESAELELLAKADTDKKEKLQKTLDYVKKQLNEAKQEISKLMTDSRRSSRLKPTSKKRPQ